MQDTSNFCKQLPANMFQMNMFIKYIHNEQNSNPYSQALLLVYSSYLTTNFTEVFEVLPPHKQELESCHVSADAFSHTCLGLPLVVCPPPPTPRTATACLTAFWG